VPLALGRKREKIAWPLRRRRSEAYRAESDASIHDSQKPNQVLSKFHRGNHRGVDYLPLVIIRMPATILTA